MSIANGINIRVHKFYTKVESVKDINGKSTGETKYIDYVEYGPPGLANSMTTVARIDRMKRVTDPAEGSANPVVSMHWNKWKYIEPLYDAWKRGEALPESGTPLAALHFLREEDFAVLKAAGVKTVEDLATLLDTNMEKTKLPQMREKRAQAKAFLEAKDANVATAKLDAQAQEIAELKAQMAELLTNRTTATVEVIDEVDENGDRIPKKRKTLTVPQAA